MSLSHFFPVGFFSGAGVGLLVCRLENPSLAAEKESRLLLYQNLDSDLDNLSCAERLAKAQLAGKNRARTRFHRRRFGVFTVCLGLSDPTPPPSVSLSAEEHNQTIPHQFSPTAWKVVYADRYTCQVKDPPVCLWIDVLQ